MERNVYLRLCQAVSMLPTTAGGLRPGLDIKLTVTFNGADYYPVKYEIGFDKGEPVRSALLHELNSNTVIHAPLEQVDLKGAEP